MLTNLKLTELSYTFASTAGGDTVPTTYSAADTEDADVAEEEEATKDVDDVSAEDEMSKGGSDTFVKFVVPVSSPSICITRATKTWVIIFVSMSDFPQIIKISPA